MPASARSGGAASDQRPCPPPGQAPAIKVLQVMLDAVPPADERLLKFAKASPAESPRRHPQQG